MFETFQRQTDVLIPLKGVEGDLVDDAMYVAQSLNARTTVGEHAGAPVATEIPEQGGHRGDTSCCTSMVSTS
jgi:hypothetical protein